MIEKSIGIWREENMMSGRIRTRILYYIFIPPFFPYRIQGGLQWGFKRSPI